MTIIQIGSHVGNTKNDPIFKTIKSDTKCIFIEPVKYLFDKLKENYDNKYPNNKFIFVNKAVSNINGQLKLYVPSQDNEYNKLPYWASQLSSTDPNHVKKHKLNMKIDECTVECETLENILRENKIMKIDLLHIDTEGHDYEILKGYNFTIKPRKIMFEHKHMESEKYDELMEIIKGHGYVIEKKTKEDTCVIYNNPVNIIRKYRRSMLTMKRLNHIVELAKEYRYCNGCYVECGIAKGGCIALMKYFAPNVKIYGFDSFEGMPELSVNDNDDGKKWVGYNCSNGIKSIKETFDLVKENFKNVYIVKGYFHETLPMYVDNIDKISILRLDSDWYESTMYTLEMLYDKVMNNGVIIIDDYGTFSGCRKAVDEFRNKRNITNPLIELEKGTEWYWYKNE